MIFTLFQIQEQQSIKQVQVKNFKSIRQLSILFNDQLNSIIGPNGVGKSTLLQSIYWVLNQFQENYNQLVNQQSVGEDIEVQIQFQKRQFKKILNQEQTLSFFINNIQVSQPEYNQQLFQILNIQNEQLIGINQQESLEDSSSILDLIIDLLPQQWQQNLDLYDQNQESIQQVQKDLKQLTQKLNQQKKLCEMLNADSQKQKTKEKLIKKSKQLEKQICCTKINNSYQQLHNDEKNLDITNLDIEKYNKQIQDLVKQKDQLIQEQQQKQIELQVLQTKILSVNNELQLNYTTPARQLQQDIQKLQSSNQLQTDFIQQLTNEDLKTIDQQNKYKLQIDQLQEQLKQQIILPNEVINQLQKINQQTNQNQNQIKEQQKQINQLKQDILDKNQQIQNIQQTISQLQKKLEQQTQNLQQLNNKSIEQAQKLKEIKQQEIDCKNIIQQNLKQINENQKRLTQINQLLSAQDSAQNIIQQQAKYQTLLNNIKGQNVIGYVENLILCNDLPEQRQLIFSNNLKSLVIREANKVQEYLLLLKKARMNINIFALDTLNFNKQSYNQHYQKMKNNCAQIQQENQDVEEITPFINKLQFSDELLPVAWFICQDIYYINCSNNQTIQQINKQLKSKIITQNNIYFSGRGQISIQLDANSNQTQVNDQQLTKIIKEKEQMEQSITQLNNQITSTQLQLNVLQNKTIGEQSILVNQLDNDVKLQQKLVDNTQQQIDDKTISLNILIQNIKELEVNYDTQLKELQELVSQLWNQQSQQLKPLLTKYNITQDQIEKYNQQTYLSTTQQDLEEVQRQFDKLDKKHTAFQQSIIQNKQLLTNNSQQLQNLQQKLNTLKTQFQSIINTQQQNKQQIIQIQSDYEQIQKQLNQIFTDLQNNKTKYQQFNQIKIQLEKDIQDQQEQLQTLIQQLLIVDNNIFTEQYSPSQNPQLFIQNQLQNLSKFINDQKLQDKQQDLQQIKIRLENEFNTVQSSTYILLQQDKLIDLQQQHSELKQNVQAQQRQINELEQGLANQFNTYIQQLQSNIEQIYKEITNQLGSFNIQTDPLTPFLEDHFQIFVQTPGDVIRPIKEISGGERQLLLLCIKIGIAITNEVDANLDLEKQQHLNKILLQFVKQNKIQLLMISHNLETIEGFDRIIGLSKRNEDEGTRGWWLESQTVEN